MKHEIIQKRISIGKQIESSKKIKQNEGKQKRENIIDEDIDSGRFFELASSNQVHVKRLNLHEIKNKILLDYKGDFELNGLMVTGHVEHKTNFTFRIMDDFESYINAIDFDYDSGVLIFTGNVYKLFTPQFNVANRSAYDEGTHYGQKIDEYYGKNFSIPTSVHCLIKCCKYFTQNDYTKEFLTFL